MDDKTDTTLHLIPRQDKLHRDQLVMSSSLHITPSTAPSAYASYMQFAIGPVKFCPRIVCQMSIMFLYHMILFIMLYHPFSHAMSYAPMFIHYWTLNLPVTHSPFVLADSFILTTHFISLTILQIIHTLLVAFILYCCSIYGSHVCGVLSWPHFLYLSCIR